jgi:hypothetical protein
MLVLLRDRTPGSGPPAAPASGMATYTANLCPILIVVSSRVTQDRHDHSAQ